MSASLIYIAFLLFVPGGTISHNVLISDGNRMVLDCGLKETHSRVLWKFTDLSTSPKIIYSLGEPPVGKHNFNCSLESRQCSLEMKAVSRNDAGVYQCQASEEGKPLGTLTEYNLNVGGLECRSNIGRHNQAVAVSSCNNIEATNLVLTCSLKYRGSWVDIPIRWRKKWSNGTYVKRNEDQPSPPSELDSGGNRTITVDFHEKVQVDMKDQSFECSVQDAKGLMPCEQKLNLITYVRDRPFKGPSISRDSLTPVTCKADASDGISCSYEWSTPDPKVKVPRDVLWEKEMKSPGEYKCMATCNLGGPEGCTVVAHEFELISMETSNLPAIVGSIVAALVIIIGIIVALLCYMRRNRPSKEPAKKDVEKNELAKVLPANEPLLSDQSRKPTADTPVPDQGSSKPPLTGQSTNGGGGQSSGHRKHSFRRGTSGKGSQDFQTIAEEGDKNQVSQIGQKIPLNDAKGQVMGIGHLENRIYCVAKNSSRLFIFIDSPPYNRMIPDEVTIAELNSPQALAICQHSRSMYISEYSDKNSIYRIFPMVKEGNKVSRGKLDGSPASIAVVSSKQNTIVVILKRDKKMHIEIYDSSNSKNNRGSVSDLETWEKKYIIAPTSIKEMTLPLFVCISGPREEAPPNSQRLYLMYGSGKYLSSGEFESYKVAQINLETSLVYKTYDLKDLTSGNSSEKFVPTSIGADDLRGGLLILEKRGQLVHLDSDLTLSLEEAKFGPSQNRFCYRAKERIVVLGSSSKPSLVCYRLRDVPARC